MSAEHEHGDRWAVVDALGAHLGRIYDAMALHPRPEIAGGTCVGCGHPWPCPTRMALVPKPGQP